MKAGTTWAYEKLRHHPQIHFSCEKEIHYFAYVAGVENQLRGENLKRRARQALIAAGNAFKRNHLSIAEYKETVDWYLNYYADGVNDH